MLIPQEGEKLMPKDMEELLLPILDQRHREELGKTDKRTWHMPSAALDVFV